MTGSMEGADAIGVVDAILAQGGLTHGKRATRHKPESDPRQEEGTSCPIQAPQSVRQHPTNTFGSASRAIQPGLVKIAEWSRFPWLRAGFSTRRGGESTAYREDETSQAEQNLGWTADDPAEIVSENRRRFCKAMAGRRAMELVTMRQFHGGMVRLVDDSAGPLATAEGKAMLRGDGLMTERAGLLLGVQTADCVPVLIADTRTRAVAAFHAGWRGTLARIVERGVGAMRLELGSKPADLIAAIGPAIGACCFAVGEEVRSEFESQFSYGAELFSEVYDSDPVRQKYPMLFLTARAPGHSNLGPQIHLDLWEANRRQLLNAGVAAEAISVVAECTACARLLDDRRKYFSHRAERGFTGRMLSVIGVEG